MTRNEVYLLRHAQSVGNKTGEYDTSNHGALSDRGRRQADAIVDPLAELSVDSILVSPLERARRTVRPYLAATDETAEVWPELSEACWHTDHEDRRVEAFDEGRPIELPADEARYFSVAPDEYPPQHTPEGERYAAGLTRIRLAHERIERRLDGPDDSLLVVAHGHLNPRLAELLLDMDPYGRMDHANTGLTRIWEPPEEKHDRRLAFCNRPLTDE